eukprot:CAMPEP_0198139044 /NCGR_PEP_ID=MMETSP1443-20131203/2386_1 /TAXON_ID=186043 /ORGANISM="Entomoneis sp., Strain CCMP2396" /LENGTH=119 /DNA_ID=CAMNT_0043801035 /DNA_START=1 /DNA_END=356 /DNA_ORIENTATION=-
MVVTSSDMGSTYDKKLMVALVGSTAASSVSAKEKAAKSIRKDRASLNLHHREDPCTNERRLYVVIEEPKSSDNSTGEQKRQQLPNRLCEVQVLPPRNKDEKETYSSFLVKSESAAHVIG